MIGRLGRLLGDDAHLLRAFLVWSVAANVLRGAAFGWLVPTVAALLDAGPGAAVGPLVGFAATTVAATAAGYVAKLRSFDVGARLQRTLRGRLGDHLTRLPIGWFTAERTGALRVTLSRGVMDLSALPVKRLEPIIAATVTPAVLVAVIAVFDPLLGLVLLAAAPVVSVALLLAGRLGRRADAAVDAAAAEAAERIVEHARQQPLLRAYDRRGTWRDRVDRALADLQRRERRQLLLVLPPVAINGSVARVAFLGVMAVAAATGTEVASTGEVATLIALLVIANRVLEPIAELAGHRTALRIAAAQLAEVEAVLTARPLPQPVHAAPTPTTFDLELHDVSFGHRTDAPVLHEVSLHLPAGSLTAIVGASGAGKSTLLALLARAIDPDAGRVTIGATDLRDLTDQQLASLTAPVFQEAYLLPTDLRSNVALGAGHLDDQQLADIARVARLTEVVDRLPQGWTTRVGDGGVPLSGGERQRVAVARAMAKHAPILLLDEAASALDPENAAAVVDAIDAERGRRTIVVVTHQLATVTTADRIVVLDRGRIVEVGTHEQLVAADGPYTALWRAMMDTQGWQLTRS